jgi:hypothetical protein
VSDLVLVEQKARTSIEPIIEKVKAFVIQDERQYQTANDLVRFAKQVIAEREKEIGPIKEANTKAWQASNALYKKYVSDPTELVKALDRRAYAWYKTEEKRVADENERARKAAEAKANEAKLEAATKLEAAGMTEAAEAVLDAKVPVEIAEQKVEKAAGTVVLENWQARVVDADAVPREFCSPDPVKLGRYAKLMKTKAQVAGVVFEDIGTVRRSRV